MEPAHEFDETTKVFLTRILHGMQSSGYFLRESKNQLDRTVIEQINFAKAQIASDIRLLIGEEKEGQFILASPPDKVEASSAAHRLISGFCSPERARTYYEKTVSFALKNMRDKANTGPSALSIFNQEKTACLSDLQAACRAGGMLEDAPLKSSKIPGKGGGNAVGR